jgi:uncharacterized membrane protein YtjA (UPF0391 family)
MFRWAIICLVISLIAGGLGLTNISKLAKRLSLIFSRCFFSASSRWLASPIWLVQPSITARLCR